ncbi:MAG: TrbI/VirB10 family protein [Gammaproteobacteria bacterium]
MTDELNSSKGSDVKESKSGKTTLLCILFLVVAVVFLGSKLLREDKGENVEREKVVHEDINLPSAQKTQVALPPVPQKQEPMRVGNRRQPSQDQIAVGRLMAPSVIFNNDTRAIGGGDTSSVAGKSNKSLDPDSAWANAIEQSSVKVSAASQQVDLDYKILQGKRFNGVLTHAINSDLPGMVVAEISQPVYGEMGTEILLPKGTRLVGQYNASVKKGQSRLFFVWQRAITPSGIDIDISSPGADRMGQAGLTGDVDTHFWEVFGQSVLMSSLALGVSSFGEQGLYANQYQNEVGQSLIDASSEMMLSNDNIKPTIRIEQGTIINIVAAKDLDFSGVYKKQQDVVF